MITTMEWTRLIKQINFVALTSLIIGSANKWWWAIWLWGVQVLVINAYVLYKTAHEVLWRTKKEKLMSHFEFQKMIALTWITQECYPQSGVSSKRSMTTVKREKKRNEDMDNSIAMSSNNKATRVNNSMLDPTHGTLKIQLSDDSHWHVHSTAKDAICSLHQWALGCARTKHHNSIMHCDHCNVNLCLVCFKIFHNISDVKKLKSEVEKATMEQ